MLQTYLVNGLIFCGILLLLAITVAVIQGVIILIDVRRVTKEVRKKMLALTSVIDIVTLLLGGMGEAKKRLDPSKSTLIAFVAGLKKGLQILLKK